MGQNKKLYLYEIALMVTALIWGWGFMATRIAVDAQLSASFIMMFRFFIAALVFGAVFWKHIRSQLSRTLVSCGALMGVFLFLGFILQTVAMEHTTPSNAAFLTATNVVMVPFLWWGVVKKRPPVRMMVACVCCLAGIFILSVKWGEGFSMGLGDLLSLLCAFFFAGQIVLTGLFTARMDPKALVFIQFLTSALLSTVFFLLFDRDFTAFLPSKGLAAVLYLGVFSTCLCYFLQTTAQAHVPASKAAIFLCTESLFGTIFSVLMGYEPVTTAMVAGGAVILGSVLLSEWNPAPKS